MYALLPASRIRREQRWGENPSHAHKRNDEQTNTQQSKEKREQGSRYGYSEKAAYWAVKDQRTRGQVSSCDVWAAVWEDGVRCDGGV